MDYSGNDSFKSGLTIETNTKQEFAATYKFENVVFKYRSNSYDAITKSSLKIFDKNIAANFLEFNFNNDTSQPSYKLASHEGVITEADKIGKIYTIDQIEKISANFESFGKLILSDEKIDHSSLLIQSLFFHNAIINTVKKSIQNNTDCNCTPHPGYFVGKVSFWCQEDYPMKPSQFVEAVDDASYSMSASEKKIYNQILLMKNKGLEYVSSDKIFSLFEKKDDFMNKINKLYFVSTNKNLKYAKKYMDASKLSVAPEDNCTKGSDLGCCGNYAGCCLYWSMLCLAHDIECLHCDHWHCGPSCKPEPKAE